MWPAAWVATPAPNEVVDVWQLPQSPDAGWLASCAGVGRVTMVTPAKFLPASWHVAQGTPATGAWFIGVPAKLENADVEWQLSQAEVPVGICVPGGDTGFTPANASPVA